MVLYGAVLFLFAGRRGGPKRRLFIGYLNGGLKRIALITMVKHG